MKRVLIAVAASVTFSCAAYWVGGVRGGDHIRVPHDVHKKAQVDCIACHDEVWDAKDLTTRGLPPESKCMECHKEKKDAGECSMCHTDVKKAGPWPKAQPSLVFNHAKHIERVKEDCSRCHTQLPSPMRSEETPPKMAACLGCHEHRKDYDDGRCMKCHTDLSRYPTKPLADFTHKGDFLRNHAVAARAEAESCATCHEQRFCADCHAAATAPAKIETFLPERVDRSFIHRNDFISRHSIEASADPASCNRCHGTSFCTDCHAAQGLGTLPPSTGRNPHPNGWMLPGTANFHGPAARRDINSCAACHDQGPRTNCINCHKVGGPGGNPHPTGFTARHGKDEIHQNGMCLYCHQ